MTTLMNFLFCLCFVAVQTFCSYPTFSSLNSSHFLLFFFLFFFSLRPTLSTCLLRLGPGSISVLCSVCRSVRATGFSSLAAFISPHASFFVFPSYHVLFSPFRHFVSSFEGMQAQRTWTLKIRIIPASHLFQLSNASDTLICPYISIPHRHLLLSICLYHVA